MNTKIVKILIALIFAISIVMLTMPITLAAPVSGECGDTVHDAGQITWSFDSSTGELKLEGSGEMNSYRQADDSEERKYDTPWKEYLNDINKITVCEGITKISSGAFAQAVNLTDVSLPSTINKIDNATFYGCSSLKNIDIPESITEIGYYAFENCASLESVTIPDGVTYIGESAFAGCTSLKNVDFPDHSIDFHRNVFRNCVSLKSVSIPKGCTYIKSDMFRGCEALECITIPSSVTIIQLSAFWSCDSFKDIYYSGSKSEWNEVNIDETEESSKYELGKEFLNANVHYNSDVDAGALSTIGTSSDNAESEANAVEKGNDTLMIILIVGGVVFVAAAGVVLHLLLKRK